MDGLDSTSKRFNPNHRTSWCFIRGDFVLDFVEMSIGLRQLSWCDGTVTESQKLSQVFVEHSPRRLGATALISLLANASACEWAHWHKPAYYIYIQVERAHTHTYIYIFIVYIYTLCFIIMLYLHMGTSRLMVNYCTLESRMARQWDRDLHGNVFEHA